MSRPPRTGLASRRSPHRAQAGGLLALALALATQAGCGREFFREWADQDASEAVFEKSRDPRWRIDLFSIEPPSMARFADPYDPDTPPAPPDDLAAEALSPVPQWPDHRLVVPIEGTGYLGILEEWRRQQPPEETPAPTAGTAPVPRSRENLLEQPGGPIAPESPAPPPVDQPAPFGPGENSGPQASALSPTSLRRPTSAPPTAAAVRPTASPKSPSKPLTDQGLRAAGLRDRDVQRAQTQATPTPGTSPEAEQIREAPLPGNVQQRPRDLLPAPRLDLDPVPIDQDFGRPLRPDSAAEVQRTPVEVEEGSEMSGILSTPAPVYDEARAAGLPTGSLAYRINPSQALTLALTNSRAYQSQLEDIYLSSLAVTQQRFAFEPQFVVGTSPLTTPGGLVTNPGNSFLYRTREAPGGQISALNLGQVAGFGKLFMTGGRLLGSFASQTVFNFIGTNPRQPSVQSSLPLSFVQPFLRGGGRAVTLEALTQAERSLLYTIRTFTRFRQQFFTSIMVGQALPGGGGGVNDPVIGFLPVLNALQQVEIERRNLASFELTFKVYEELAQGEPSGIAQLQVDQVDTFVQQARQTLAQNELNYRNLLDQYRQQLGLPPDTPIVLDRSLFEGFTRTFNNIDRWGENPKREFEELERIVATLPDLEDIVIDGRSVLEVGGKNPEDPYSPGLVKTDELEDLLRAGVRIAFENRLDLMNARAQLYDAWRQIRVTANGLRGILNVAVTNQILTPANTTNPFAFIDQAKQFQLVLNAELPLVRLVERNQFRTAWINFQRQRRALMFAEDAIKFQIRQNIRQLQTQFQVYQVQKRNLLLNIRQKDQSQENILAPPAGGAGQGQANNAATQTLNLTQAQQRIAQFQGQLTNTWLQYQTQRLALYRDLGIMPYDEWEAYYELFPSNTAESGGAPGAGSEPAGAAAAPAPETAAVGGR